MGYPSSSHICMCIYIKSYFHQLLSGIHTKFNEFLARASWYPALDTVGQSNTLACPSCSKSPMEKCHAREEIFRAIFGRARTDSGHDWGVTRRTGPGLALVGVSTAQLAKVHGLSTKTYQSSHTHTHENGQGCTMIGAGMSDRRTSSWVTVTLHWPGTGVVLACISSAT